MARNWQRLGQFNDVLRASVVRGSRFVNAGLLRTSEKSGLSKAVELFVRPLFAPAGFFVVLQHVEQNRCCSLDACAFISQRASIMWLDCVPALDFDNDRPKQFLELQGETVLDHSLRLFLRLKGVSQ